MRHIKLTDGRQIVAVERGGLPDLIRREEKASKVLVNVDEPFDQEFVEQFVMLHDLGCDRFLCSGSLSERLHDAIDDRLCESENADEVMTTFHDEDELLDDVVALFLELGAVQGSRLIYVYGSSPRDRSILEKLQSLSREQT